MTTAAATGVLVGLDGSERGRAAAQWAAQWAHQLGVDLTLVTVLPSSGRGGGSYAARVEELATQMSTHAGEVRSELARAHPSLHIAELVEQGAPAPTLVELAASARGMVIGTRGLRGFRAMALGAVADHVVTYAQTTVVVVPGTADLATTGPVVVGVDGSPESFTAMSFAAEEADRRDCGLQVVSVWDGAGLVPIALLAAHSRGELASHDPAEGKVAEEIAALQAAHPGLEVERVIDQGKAAETLVRASRTASLLVVASRGRGAFPGMVLGSTSRAVAQHAECPVAVLHR